MKIIEKPLILSIDTSGDICSIAISSSNSFYLHYSINVKRYHDKLLAEITRRAMNDLEIDFSSIDAIAISSGPGSFTGLRIGASFAKALCIDESPKLIAVPTLLAYSVVAEETANLLGIKKIHSLISANSGITYHQLFDNKSNKLSEPEMLKIDNIIQDIQNNKDDCKADFFVGNAVASLNNLNVLQISELNLMDALKNSVTAWRLYNQGLFTDPLTFEPEYIQDVITK